MQGETSSLKRILEKYIEKSPLWHFFSLSGTILYLSLRGNERGWEEGMDAIFSE